MKFKREQPLVENEVWGEIGVKYAKRQKIAFETPDGKIAHVVCPGYTKDGKWKLRES